MGQNGNHAHYIWVHSPEIISRPEGLRACNMIGIGLVALVIATLEHRRDLNALKAEYPGIPRSLARVLAALVSILGILAFVSALLRQ